jgi:hypothetical protein
MTSDNLIRETPKGCGDCITTIMGGKMTLRFWKCSSAKRRSPAACRRGGKFLEFDQIHPAFSALTFGGE